MKRGWFLFIICATLLAAATASAQDTASQDLVPFVPDPDGVFIQRIEGDGSLGNVRIVVQLGKAGIERLKDVTGHRDFIVLGPPGGQTILRDDGVEPDDRGGDGHYAGFASISEDALAGRAEQDRSNTGGRSTVTVPAFNGRSKTGNRRTAPFDIEGFLAGELVPLDRAVTSSDSSSDQEPTNPNAIRAIELGHLVPAHEPIEPASARVVTPGTNVFQERVLMIRHPSVVEDPTRTFDACTGNGTPMGVWTFGHLMREMANQAASGINPSDLVEQWLLHWASFQTVNTFTVPPRVAINSLINDWRAASGGGDLDLSIAPFRLLAIVPRLDLRRTVGSTGGYGGVSSGKFLDAGEARFVFGVILPRGYNPTPFAASPIGGGCFVLPFSVIFEYGVPKCECEDVRSWAADWVSLASLPFPSSTYNGRLEKLTEQFVRAGANPLKPNGNALNQLRTNEIAMDRPWELREFRLLTFPFDFLHETTAVDTPNNDTAAGTNFNNTVTLSNFILSLQRPVPLLLPGGTNFLGANPETTSPAFTWNGPLPLDAATNMAHSDLRHNFSLGTCNGCHGRDPLTPFVHIDPSTFPLPAALSGFLTGIAVNDPIYVGVGAPKVREFDDLELRERDIQALARTDCFRHRTINRIHVLEVLRKTGVLPVDPFKGLPPVPLEKQPTIALDDLLADLPTQPH